jgi:hypothetical protein
VTAQGHPYARFRKALDRGNTLQAMAAAAELEHVGLVEALELVLLLARDGDEPRFRRAAVRWAGRYGRETADVEPAEAQAVLALVSMLAGPRSTQAAYALAQLLDRREHLPAAEVLLRAHTAQ